MGRFTRAQIHCQRLRGRGHGAGGAAEALADSVPAPQRDAVKVSDPGRIADHHGLGLLRRRHARLHQGRLREQGRASPNC